MSDPPGVFDGKRRYPAGYTADAQRPDVFDPALKHYLHGFVKGCRWNAVRSKQFYEIDRGSGFLCGQLTRASKDQ